MRFARRIVRFARGCLGRWSNRRRMSHAITVEGLVFIVLLAAIGFAAVNTGANLLYLVFAMMAALIIVSALASWIALRGLDIRRRAPKTAAAGEVTSIIVEATNAKRFFHSYSLRIVDQQSGGRAAGILYLMRLGNGQTARLEYPAVFERRGLQQWTGLKISTRFPFGFVERSVRIPAPQQILVYPRMCPAGAFLEQHCVEMGRQESGRKGHGASLFALRPYTRDDSARMIHWKVSAKSSDLIVREMETDERQKFSLILDNSVEDGRRLQLEENFERAVSCAASVARELLRQSCQTEVLTRSGRIPFDCGAQQLERILRALALIELRQRDGRTPPLPRPDPDSQALWFDYGAGVPAAARVGAPIRLIDVSSWPDPAAIAKEAV